MRKTLKRKGFTLVEILVALFVFVILMVAVSQIFVAAFTGYRDARTVQKDLQNAQYTLNSMAKILRTSTVVSPASPRITSGVKIFFYPQNLCIRYRISKETLSVASAPAGDADKCKGFIFSSGDFAPLTSGNVTGKFVVTPSRGGAPKRVGKVTVSLEIREGTTHVARIQSSTSLRDYGNVGW